VDELLLLASVHKIEEVELEPLDMAGIVAEAQRRLAGLIQEHGAEISMPDEWPEAMGRGPWVEEIWVNYLSNAIKYGGVPPRVELGATEQVGGMIRFWVHDNGAGLSIDEQAQLFRPFTLFSQTRLSGPAMRRQSMQVEGHGLGLSIVQRIVEKMGGQVGVESEDVPGKGSTFSFDLPGVT
jgi:signal transduction histidine kinase